MIPLIDCSSISEGDLEDNSFGDFTKVAQEICAAMTGIGMCHLINHGISRKKIKKVHEVSELFFKLPTQTKLKYKKASPKNSYHGYTGPGGELLNEKEKNFTELKECWDVSGSDGFDEKMYPNVEVPDFKVALDDLRSELERAAKKILRCIEICLKLEEGTLTSQHKNLSDHSIKSKTQLRSLYYYMLNPTDNIPMNAIRLSEHSDWGSLTFIIQDMVGGLEVKTSEREWIPAVPVENAILVNSGYLMEYWTGGHFHAAPHRVRIVEDSIGKKPRQSIAFFISPDADVNVFPLVPVLAEKETNFAKFNNEPVNGYDYYQRLIEGLVTMIPLIDCSPIADVDFEDVCFDDFNEVAQEIGKAMTGIGMCNLINFGINMEKIEKIYEVSKTFFTLPTQTKEKYRKTSPIKSFYGYSGPGEEFLNKEEENATELKEFWDIWGSEAYDEKMFPSEVPDFKNAFDDVRSELENAGKKILRCVEIYLDLNEGALISKHKNLSDHSIKTQTQMRSLYYYTLNPNDNFPSNAIRCGEHSDWGTITFLFQDMVGGLEVKTSEGEWIPAVPVKNAILVNSGQLLEYWTGGHFHAATHRVRIITEGKIAKEPRQSFVYFISPDGDANVSPIVPVLAEKEPQLQKFNNEPVNAFEHNQRLIEAVTLY